MKRITLLSNILLFLPFFTCAQTDRQVLAAKDTRILHDARGHGFDAALHFVYQDPKKYPVMIGVATGDKKFIEAVKQVIREMDWAGYENLSLILMDINSTTKEEIPSHEIMFFRNGELTGLILKTKSGWAFGSLNANKKMSGIALNDSEEYPLTLIRTKIRTTHEGSGASNYTQGMQN